MSIISQRSLPSSSPTTQSFERKFRRNLMPMPLGKLEQMLEDLAAAIDPKHLDRNQRRNLQRISLVFLDAIERKQLTEELKRHKTWNLFQDRLAVIQLMLANVDCP